MHAHAKQRVKAAAHAICDAKNCEHCHEVASDALGASDDAFRSIVEQYEEMIVACKCPDRLGANNKCDRCRGRRDVIDAVRPFLVPA